MENNEIKEDLTPTKAPVAEEKTEASLSTQAPVAAKTPENTPRDESSKAIAMDAAKKKKLIIWGAVAVIAIIIGIIWLSTLGGGANNGIDIIEEQLVTDARYTIIGNNLYPIVVMKVKNTSRKTKKVSFEANFYADGELLGSDQANYITLAPGDEAYLHAQSDRGYVAWSQHEYSYKITKWWVFDQ